MKQPPTPNCAACVSSARLLEAVDAMLAFAAFTNTAEPWHLARQLLARKEKPKEEHISDRQLELKL